MSAPERPALLYPGYCDGIDISQVQGIYDPKAIADDGFLWASVKASEGLYYCDPKALELLKMLRDVGLITNVYTFLRPSQGNPREQVRKAYECAGDVFPTRLLLDAEGATDEWTPEKLVFDFYEPCVDECLQNGILYPEFYSFPYFVQTRLLPAIARSTLIGRCPYHAAHYGSNTLPWLPPIGFVPYFPNPPWPTWTKHQYSGNGGYRVRGIYGDCDRNLFNGSLEALRRYHGFNDPGAPTVRELPSSVIDDATLDLGAELAEDFKRRPIGE